MHSTQVPGTQLGVCMHAFSHLSIPSTEFNTFRSSCHLHLWRIQPPCKMVETEEFGMPPFPPFSLGVHTFVTLPGVLAAMAQCEKQGKLRIIRLPFVGPWASRQLKVLRRKLATPLARPASKRRPDSATHAAAAARREVGLIASPPPPPSYLSAPQPFP